MAKNLTVKIGSRAKPMYPSEPGYVQSVNAQMKAVSDAIQDIFEQLEDVSEDIMIEALQPTFIKARDVYCPIKTGDLRRSGYLEPNGVKGQPHVEIGFGRNGEPPYTVYVHEVTDQQHAPPTQAKFLQRAVLEDLPVIFARLNQGYMEFMGSGL